MWPTLAISFKVGIINAKCHALAATCMFPTTFPISLIVSSESSALAHFNTCLVAPPATPSWRIVELAEKFVASQRVAGVPCAMVDGLLEFLAVGQPQNYPAVQRDLPASGATGTYRTRLIRS